MLRNLLSKQEILKMAEERGAAVPKGSDWTSLKHKSGAALADHYAEVLRTLGRQGGILGGPATALSPESRSRMTSRQV